MIPKDGNRLFVLMRLLILPLLFALSAPAAAANGGLYRCHALDAVSIQADGKLGRDNIDISSAKLWSSFIVDTSTGVIRNPQRSTEPSHWTVVQKGNEANDFVAVPVSVPPVGERSLLVAAAAATDFVRIRAWKRTITPLFLLFQLSRMVSGTCEPLN